MHCAKNRGMTNRLCRWSLIGCSSRGIRFDAGILAANAWVVPRLTRISENNGETSPYFGIILLTALFLYLFGAGLKRMPLQKRLAQTTRPPTPTWAWISLFTLMIMQFALGVVTVMIPLDAWNNAVPQFPLHTGNPWMMLPVFLVAGAPVAMSLRALIPPRDGIIAHSASALRRQEAFADTALFFSALVSLSIWDGMIMRSLSEHGPYPWFMGLLLVVLITVPFSMFYAAPRILFLAEDYRHPSTWIRIAAVMLPLSLRLLTPP